MESVLTFKFDKETKNYVKYKQVDGINTLYLQPGTPTDPLVKGPHYIRVVIDISEQHTPQS